MAYPVNGGVPHFVRSPGASERVDAEGWLPVLKNRIRAYPRLYTWLTDILCPLMPTGKSHRILLKRLRPDAVVLNLGAGTRRLSRSLVNVDYSPFPDIDIVADITRLPFQDNAVDGIISEVTLEHVRDARAALDEMRRTLKPGGYLYVVVPFIVGYHSAPNDYYRWTSQGLVADLKGFETIEVGVRSGPTSALLWVLQEWLALVFSFNSRVLYTVLWLLLLVLTFPLKLLDVIFGRYAMAWKIAAMFYYFGAKKRS